MELVPVAEAIPRDGRGTSPEEGLDGVTVADWADMTRTLRAGKTGVFWLSAVRDGDAPHVRPVLAAWAGSSFYLASKGSAAKSRHLDDHPHASISADLEVVHLVVEGVATRVTDPDGLSAASAAMQDVFGWPTRVSGDELDADYGAPTSGGPPYQVYELVPVRAFAFPTDDQVEPTRWTFPSPPVSAVRA